MCGAARDEGGLSTRQLKNAAAEPPNRYEVRHVLPPATNESTRLRRAGPGAGAPCLSSPLLLASARFDAALYGLTSIHHEFHENRSDAFLSCYSVVLPR